MAVQITDENFEQYLAQYTRALESEGEVKGVTIITNPDSIRNTLTLPGVNYDTNPISNPNARASEYVQIPYSVLSDTLDDMNAAVEWMNTYKPQVIQATDEADNVNAELVGMTVIVTDRQGTAHSTNIGFEVYRTYPSVSAMNADAANVPEGKFVMIATSDPTDPDNAKLYGKNSQGGFTFLSDLDQASSAAWADWLDNMKPQIEDATDAANAAADRVDDCIATANQDHTRAVADHTQAGTDHAQYATDHQTFLTNEAQRQSDFDDAQAERNTTWTSWFSDSLSTGVRKLWNDFWSGVNTSWNGFFGTSADDPNGVRKIWTTWYSSTQSSWNAFWPAAKNTWESWFGTSSSTGVQGEWADLKSDAVQDHTTATSDHTIASSDHTQAVQDHTTAGTDHGVAESDHTQATNDHTASVAATANANEQASYAENVASHPSYIADGTQEKPGDIGYVYQWDYAHQQYVRGIRVSLDWDTMSQEEKDALAAEVLASIAFDEVPTPDSNKAVRSSGVYTALQGKSGIDHTHDLKDLGDDEMHRLVTDDEKRSWNSKQSALTFATEVTCESIVGELT